MAIASRTMPNGPTGSPRELGQMVRDHLGPCLGIQKLCGLFHLTEDGARKILDGEDWWPEYERPAVSF